LARALVARGDRVTALVRPRSDCRELAALDLELAEGDVTQPDTLTRAVAEVDVVYHLAGLIKAFSLTEFLRVNEQGTRNLAEVCATRTTPPVLVAVSSLAAAGPSPDGRPRTELDPPQPVSNYGLSKRAGELAATGVADRLPLSIVRPPIVFGPRDASMLPLFRSIARRGLHAVPGNEPRRLSLIHVSDLVAALVAVAERGTRVPPAPSHDARGTPGHYYVADDACPTFDELGQLIGRAVGRERVRVLHTPHWLDYTAARLLEIVARLRGRQVIFNVDKVREGFAGSWTCSSERIRGELAFAVGASLDERMRETGEWYRREGWL
jgi:nucleoside-diphosphate-sugar epimerase